MIVLGVISISFIILYSNNNIDFEIRKPLFIIGYLVPFLTIFLILLLPRTKNDKALGLDEITPHIIWDSS